MVSGEHAHFFSNHCNRAGGQEQGRVGLGGKNEPTSCGAPRPLLRLAARPRGRPRAGPRRTGCPMIVTCPGCQKKLKVPDGAAGTKARCPACKGVVTVPGSGAPPPLPERPAAPARARDDEDEEPRRRDDEGAPRRRRRDEEAPDAGLRCALCESPNVEELPPNQFSRRPGYVCRACGAAMRPPGSVGGYVFAVLLGGFVVLLGIGLGVVALGAERGRGRMLFGAASLVGLGAAVA